MQHHHQRATVRPTALLIPIILCAVLIMPGCWTWRWGSRESNTSSPNVNAEPSAEQIDMLIDARAAGESGEYEKALAMFNDIIAENPTITSAYVGIADVHMAREDYEKAEPAYRRAARLEPGNYQAQFGHGRALQMLKRFMEAIRAYHRALVIRPDSFKANRNLASTYLELDQPDRALTFAKRAAQLKPDSASAHTNLGVVHTQLGEHKKAIEQFVTAMELDEPNEHLLINLIESLGKEKRYREAVNAALTLTRIAPSANAYERLGWAHFKVGEYDKSTQAYQKAVERDPQNWVAWRGVGVNALNEWVRSNKQDAEAGQQARQAFRKSLQINPKQPKVVRVMSNYGLN